MKPSQLLPLFNAALCGCYIMRFVANKEFQIAGIAVFFGILAIVGQKNLLKKEEE